MCLLFIHYNDISDKTLADMAESDKKPASKTKGYYFLSYS